MALGIGWVGKWVITFLVQATLHKIAKRFELNSWPLEQSEYATALLRQVSQSVHNPDGIDIGLFIKNDLYGDRKCGINDLDMHPKFHYKVG